MTEMKMFFNKNILIDIFNPFMKKRSHQKVITAMQIFLNKEIRIDIPRYGIESVHEGKQPFRLL